MKGLREFARGKPCQVRLIGICNQDEATTVLAHLRMSGITGVGLKADDLFGAWCCSACHDEIDRRTQHLPHSVARLAHLEGIVRTQNQLLKDRIIRW